MLTRSKLTRRSVLVGAAGFASYPVLADGLSSSVAQQIGGALSAGFDGGISGGSGTPSWVTPGAAVDMDFANGLYFGGTLANLLSISRASNATDLLPSSASGYAYNTFSSNVLSVSPTFGLLIFEARTNLLLNSNAPATQTTASLGVGTYTNWVNGPGSALVSGGTATITGAAPATNGSPNTFNVTVAGTVIDTVTGSLNGFQLELGAFGTSFIVTAGATATRVADVCTSAGVLLALLSAAQGTVVAQMGPFPGGATNPSQGGTVFGSSNSTLQRYPFNNTDLQTFNGGTGLRVNVGGAAFAGNLKAGVAWSGAGRSVAGNNVLATDANTISSPSQYVGSANTTGQLNGYIKRFTVFPTRLSDAALQALTV